MKTNSKNIMRAAWSLARQGALRFGDGAGLYLRESLRIVWREYRDVPVYQRGLGTRLWMSIAPRQEQSISGQAMLPGISAK